jgi:hypothetical protein
MAKTNAEYQQAYRERHLKDFDSDNTRLDVVISGPASRALHRMAAQTGVTQRTMLEAVLTQAEAVILAGLDNAAQELYYSQKIKPNITRLSKPNQPKAQDGKTPRTTNS